MKYMRISFVFFLAFVIMIGNVSILPPSITKAANNPKLGVARWDCFSSSLNSWSAAYGGTLSLVTSGTHSGLNAAKVSSRTGNYMGPTQNVTSVVSINGQGNYTVSAWAKLGTGSDGVNIAAAITDSAGTHWATTSNVTTGTEWTQVSGTLNLTWTGTLTSVIYFVETQTSLADLYVDDLQNPELLSNRGFDSVLTPWSGLGGSLSLVTTGGHSGANAALVSSRTGSYMGPAQNVTSAVSSNGQGNYTVSAWAKLGTGSNGVNISMQIIDSAGTHYAETSYVTTGTGWTQVSGTLNLTWTGTLTSVIYFVQTQTSLADLYVDDVSLQHFELLSSPGLESGLTPWSGLGGSLSLVTTGVHSGTNAALVSSRTGVWMGPSQDIKNVVSSNGQGNYTVSAWAKLGKGSDGVHIVAKIVDSAGTHYAATSFFTTGTGWTRISGTLNLTWTGTLTSVIYYVETQTSLADLYVDDASLQTAGNLLINQGFEPCPDTVALSPGQFNNRVPYFLTINSPTSVTGDESSQATIDQQINYAADAGIDYWAFVNAGQNNMSMEGYALSYYLSSSYKSRLGFTLIIHNLPSTEAQWSTYVDNIVSNMLQPTWVRVTASNRPLIYIFDTTQFSNAYGTNAQAQINLIRTKAQAAGLPNPYIVNMGDPNDPSGAAAANTTYGLDAISAYGAYPSGSSDPSNPTPFSTFASANTSEWTTYANTGKKIIPHVSIGWNQYPRTLNPPPWGGGGPPYFATPTPSELANHIWDGMSYSINNPTAVESATILIYAWNEVAEGGWMVPTNSEGTARLDAIHALLTANRLQNTGFESGLTSWNAQNASIASDSANPHYGFYAVKISNRTAVWGAANQDIKSVLLSNGQGNYSVSAWAKFATGSDNVRIIINTVDSAGSHWFSTTGASVGTSYTHLSGTLNLTWTGTLSSATIYTQSNSSTADMYEDEFSLIKQ